MNLISLDQPVGRGGEDDYSIHHTVAAETPDPEESYIIKQKIQLMRGIVERLKPHYRTLIEMRYFKELSYEEIADELNLPLGTVKAQLFRAREFLYQIVKNASDSI